VSRPGTRWFQKARAAHLARAAVAFGLLSAWLVSLLAGVALGGAIHLVLAVALLVFPWRLLGEGEEAPDERCDDE
jgi:hypothetical protein